MSDVRALPVHVRRDLDDLRSLLVGQHGDPSSLSLDGLPLLTTEPDELARVLYGRWYVRWEALPEPPIPHVVSLAPPRALRVAHPGGRRFEPGWTVLRSSSRGRAVVERDGVQRLVDRPDLIVPDAPGRRPVPGDDAAVVARVDEVDEDEGFWITYHPRWEGGDRLVRLYWRIAPEHAPRLVDRLVTGLTDVPHAVKVAARWEGFARADAAVLYVPRAMWGRAAAAVAAVACALQPHLGGRPPRLTRPLAEGLGLAEGSGDGASFGEHRCRVVADGLQAWAAAPTRDLVAVLASTFADAGLDLATPHRAAAGSAEVVWNPTSVVAPTAGTEKRHGGGPVTTSTAPTAIDSAVDADLVDGAVTIGDRLCAEAIWHDGRCTWVGAASRQVRGVWRPVHESLTPDLYEGTAGIALFLARLAGVTGDTTHARVALGALRHACRTLERTELAPSLHTGSGGIALAAAQTATLLEDDEAAAAAAAAGERFTAAVTRRLARGAPWGDGMDLLSGLAGVLVAGLAVDALDPSMVGIIVDQLEEAAEPQPVGVAWPDLGGDGSPPLCGLAHGASGVALALLELGPDAHRAQRLALAAMDYEQSWLDRTRSNWPDLREFDRVARRTGRAPASPVYWCHGALGIGLQRLRAWELTQDAAVLADVGVALQAAGATAAVVLDADPDADPWSTNASACHGASGVVGLFTAAGLALGDPDLVAAGRRVARWMLDSYGGEREWSCGVAGGGVAPGLQLGLAGIGWTLLHAGDPNGHPVLGLLPVPLTGPPLAARGRL